MYRVYAICGGQRPHLEVLFTGNRSQCRRYILQRVRNGQPTHFLVTSKLGYDAAAKRYLP